MTRNYKARKLKPFDPPSEIKHQQSLFAMTLRNIASTRARVKFPWIENADFEALVDLMDKIELSARARYRDYQKSYGSKNLVNPSFTGAELVEQAQAAGVIGADNEYKSYRQMVDIAINWKRKKERRMEACRDKIPA